MSARKIRKTPPCKICGTLLSGRQDANGGEHCSDRCRKNDPEWVANQAEVRRKWAKRYYKINSNHILAQHKKWGKTDKGKAARHRANKQYRVTNRPKRKVKTMDRYIAWANTWGRGPVKPIHLPITNHWAIGSDETHLVVGLTTSQVLTFTTEKAAARVAKRANVIINR